MPDQGPGLELTWRDLLGFTHPDELAARRAARLAIADSLLEPATEGIIEPAFGTDWFIHEAHHIMGLIIEDFMRSADGTHWVTYVYRVLRLFFMINYVTIFVIMGGLNKVLCDSSVALVQNSTTISGTMIPPWDTVSLSLAKTTKLETAPLATVAQSPTPPSALTLNSSDNNNNDDNGGNIPLTSHNGRLVLQGRWASTETRVPQLPMTAIDLPDLADGEEPGVTVLAPDTVTVLVVVTQTPVYMATDTFAPDNTAFTTDPLAPGDLSTPNTMTRTADDSADTDAPAAADTGGPDAASTTYTTAAPSGPDIVPLPLIPHLRHSNPDPTAEYTHSTDKHQTHTADGSSSTTMSTGSATNSLHSGALAVMAMQPARNAAGALAFVAGVMGLVL